MSNSEDTLELEQTSSWSDISEDDADSSLRLDEALPLLVPKGTKASRAVEEAIKVNRRFSKPSHVRSSSCFSALNSQRPRNDDGQALYNCDSCSLLQEQFEKRMMLLKQDVARLTAENSELKCEMNATTQEMIRKVKESSENMEQLSDNVTSLRQSLMSCHTEVTSQWTFALRKFNEKLECIHRDGSRLERCMIDLATRIELGTRQEALSAQSNRKINRDVEQVNDAEGVSAPLTVLTRLIDKSTVTERAVREDVLRERDIRRVHAMIENYRHHYEDLRHMGRTFEDRMTRTIEAYKKVLDSKEQDIHIIKNRCEAFRECLRNSRCSMKIYLEENSERYEQSQLGAISQRSEMSRSPISQSFISQESEISRTTLQTDFTLQNPTQDGGDFTDDTATEIIAASIRPPADDRTKQDKENENVSKELMERLYCLQRYVKEMEKKRERNAKRSEKRIAHLMEQLEAKSQAIDVHLTMQRAEIVFELKAAHQSEIERITAELQLKYRQFLEELKHRADEEIELQRREINNLKLQLKIKDGPDGNPS